MSTTKQKGDKGEILAITYLQKHNHKIIETNFKFSRFGEIDIISQKEEKTHFIEVKYRENLNFGFPEEAITQSKLKKIKKSIEFYVIKHHLSFERIQFDVITILKGDTSYKLKHYKNLEL